MLAFIAFAIGAILLLMIGGIVINVVVGVMTGIVLAATVLIRFPVPALIVAGVIGYDAYARAHGMPTLVDLVAGAAGGGK